MKKILVFLFLLSFSVPSFAWTRTVVDATNDLNAIDANIGTSVVTLCVGGDNGKVYTSTNFGNTWNAATNITGIPNVAGVSFASNRIVLVSNPTVGINGKVHTSDNGGSSWTERYADAAHHIWDVDFGSSTAGVFVGDVGGTVALVGVSSNGGLNWTTTSYGAWGPNLPRCVFFLKGTNHVWLGGGGGMIRHSSDGGQNWGAAQTTGVTNTVSDIYFVDENNGFAATWAGGNPENFLYTTNGGTSWSKLDVGVVNDNFGLFFLNATTGWIVGIDPGPIVTKATYSGSSWSFTQDYESPAGSDILKKIYCYDQNNMWAVGHGSGVVYTNTATPTVTSCSPNAGPQGKTGMDVVINGTNLTPGSITAAFSPAGITVNSVVWLSSTQLKANIDIASGATLGSRNVTVVNNGKTATGGTNTLTVNLPPDITSISPSFAPQGWLGTLNVTGTGFQTNATFSFRDGGGNLVQGISIISSTVNSPTSATLQIDVSQSVPIGTVYLQILNPDTGVDIHALPISTGGLGPNFIVAYYDGEKYPKSIPHPVAPTVNVKAEATDSDGYPATPVGKLLISNTAGNLRKLIDLPSSAMSVSGNQLKINYRIPENFALQLSSTDKITLYTEDALGNPGRYDTSVTISTRTDAVGYSYPNPYHGTGPLDLQFWMPSTAAQYANVRATAVDSTGRRVAESDPFTAYSGKNTYKWDGLSFTGRLPNGIILWLIRDDSTVYTKIKTMVVN